MRRTTLVLTLSALIAACSSEEPVPQMPQPTPPPLGGTAVTRGFQLYRSMRCANCHGADGRGSPGFPGAPLIIGRNAEDMRTTLVAPCTALAECHPLKVPTMTDQELTDLAAFLADLANTGTPADPGPPCDDVPGRICTIAGSGVSGNKGDGFLAREHYLFWPQNVTVDPQGRVVVTDWNNYLIRRIEKTGCQDVATGGRDCPMISIAGIGQLGDSCSSPQAPVMANVGLIDHPVGVSYDGQGGMFMWGWHQRKIKYIPVDRDGNLGEMLCMFGGSAGLAGDGGPAGYGGPAKFDLPSGADTDSAGNFYISDQGNLRIRRVLANADDVAQGGTAAYVTSRLDNIVETWAGGLVEPISRLTRRTRSDYSDSGDGGPASQATFNVQVGFDALPQMRIVMDKARNRLYVADSDNDRIRVIDLSVDPPIIDTFAGGGDDVAGNDVLARDLALSSPADVDLVPDGSGDVLITDTLNNCVRLIDFETLRARTVAGVCNEDMPGYAGDGAAGPQATLNNPGGAYMTADHTLYIADTLNQRIRRVNP